MSKMSVKNAIFEYIFLYGGGGEFLPLESVSEFVLNTSSILRMNFLLIQLQNLEYLLKRVHPI